MSMPASFKVIIPARYQSVRFPGKVLADIHGKPMVVHVIERAKEAGAKHIIVATDDLRIQEAVKNECEVVMTDSAHQSGTERLAEVIDLLSINDEEIIVNVQGDEPFVPAENIQKVADTLSNSKAHMATLCHPIDEHDDVLNPNVVKVVVNDANHALYFSRAPIPFQREILRHESPDLTNLDMSVMHRHIGIYAYTAGYLRQYVAYDPSPLEAIEHLEQLRALWYSDIIAVEKAVKRPPTGVDTPEDLKALLAQSS